MDDGVAEEEAGEHDDDENTFGRRSSVDSDGDSAAGLDSPLSPMLSGPLASQARSLANSSSSSSSLVVF